MTIKIGEKYVNKTWRFLIPVLKGHGSVFTIKFNTVFKLAVGVHDSLLDGSKISRGRNIYILLDKKYRVKDYENFIDYVRNQNYFKGEYCPDGNILNSRKHMIIIEIPYRYFNAYDKFLKGQYSKMYSDTESKLLFYNKDKIAEYEILTKRSAAFSKFIKTINKEFQVQSNPSKFYKSEWELPLKKKEEIFNYKKNEAVFFNENISKVWQ